MDIYIYIYIYIYAYIDIWIHKYIQYINIDIYDCLDMDTCNKK